MKETAKVVVAVLALLAAVLLVASIAVTYIEEKYAPRPVATMAVCGSGPYRVAVIRVDSSAPVYLKEVVVGGTRYACPLLKLVPGKDNLVVLAGHGARGTYGYVCTVAGPGKGTELVFLSGRVVPAVSPCPKKGLEDARDK